MMPIECYWICILWELLRASYSLGIVNSFLSRFRVSHIAVEVPGEDCRNEWCEPVSDTEYNAL